MCEYVEYRGSLGVRGSVLGVLGLMALDWALEGCLDVGRRRREVKGLPNVEIEAACDHGRGRLVEERLLGKETTEEEGWAH